MNAMRIFTLLVAVVVAFAFFGLIYSATIVADGALRATSLGLLGGLIGFFMAVFVVHMFRDLGK